MIRDTNSRVMVYKLVGIESVMSSFRNHLNTDIEIWSDGIG